MPRALLPLLLSTLPLISCASQWPCDNDHSDQVRNVPDWLQRALPEYTLAHPDTTDAPVFYRIHTLGPFPTETRSIRLVHVDAIFRAALVHHGRSDLLLIDQNNAVLAHWHSGSTNTDRYAYDPDVHALRIDRACPLPLTDRAIDELVRNPDPDPLANASSYGGSALRDTLRYYSTQGLRALLAAPISDILARGDSNLHWPQTSSNHIEITTDPALLSLLPERPACVRILEPFYSECEESFCHIHYQWAWEAMFPVEIVNDAGLTLALTFHVYNDHRILELISRIEISDITPSPARRAPRRALLTEIE